VTEETKEQTASKMESGALPLARTRRKKVRPSSSGEMTEQKKDLDSVEDSLCAVVTVEFYKVRPPKVTVEGERPPSLGKFERQLINIYRALQAASARVRREQRVSNG